MKSYMILLSFLFLTAIATTSFVLASPLDDTSNDALQNEGRAHRTRRDITGVFDSIANGFEGLVKGAKKVSESVLNAFNSIFSTENKNSLSQGLETFGRCLKDAFGDVKDGFNKVGDKIKGAWNGKGNKGGSKDHPDGQVPEEETT